MAEGFGAKTLQEYLVSLGVKLDEKGMTRMDGFLRSSKMGFMALAGIVTVATTVATKWAIQINQSAIALEKEAKTQRKSIEAVRASDNALKAMGKTKQEVAKDPALKNIYNDLVKMNKAMALPDGSRGLTLVKSIMVEFYRFKSMAQYALQWINYHLITKLEGPLTRIRDSMQKWREKLQTEMPLWTEKIATGLAVFVRLLETAVRFGGKIIEFVDNLPDSMKVAGTAIAGLWSIIRAGPLGWIIAGLSTLLLLLDDYWTWQRGGKSALSGLWESIGDGTIGEKLTTAIQSGIDSLTKWIGEHKEDIGKIGALLGDIIAGAIDIAGKLVGVLLDARVLAAAITLGKEIAKGILIGLGMLGAEAGFQIVGSAFGEETESNLRKGIESESKGSVGLSSDGKFMPPSEMTDLFVENPEEAQKALDRASSNEIGKILNNIYGGNLIEFGGGQNDEYNKYLMNPSSPQNIGPRWGKNYQTWESLVSVWKDAMGKGDSDSFTALTAAISQFQKSYNERASGVQGFLGAVDTSDITANAQAAIDAYKNGLPIPFDAKYDPKQVSQATSGALDAAQREADNNPISVNVVAQYESPTTEGGDDSTAQSGTVKNDLGGRYDKPVKSTLAEDNDPEYVIPIKKLDRAIPLIQMMLAEMGDKARSALAGFGIGPDTNINDLVASKGLGRPGGGSPIINIINNYNSTVNAPATFNINGSGDPQDIGQAAYNAQERFLVRTLKAVIQSE